MRHENNLIVMYYLYHMVPFDMMGTVLYPLNQLKLVYPDLYDEHLKKYSEREVLLERKISTLDCLWNDVLHLTAVRPNNLTLALAETGHNLKLSFFQIDPSILDKSKMIVYIQDKNKKQGDFSISENDWKEFRIEDLENYSRISQDTTAYYKDSFQNKKRPLLFHGVAHILYKGTIDTKDLPVV